MIGDPLQASVATDRFPLVGTPAVDPRSAAAKTLAAYLGRIVFETVPGSDGSTSRFRLAKITTAFPVAGVEIEYPSCSIIAPAYTWDAHSLVPTMLEETADCFGPGTVLWKTDEASFDFQVDFWTNTEATRAAILAGLPRIFSPSEGRSGVMLEGDPGYFGRSVRITYLGSEEINTSDSAFDRDRRIRSTIRADIDVVHLRSVNSLDIRSSVSTTDND